jgi:uncharacterized membrane protein
MMNYFKKANPLDFLQSEEVAEILQHIKLAEEKTSGEIRIFIESRCKWVDTLRRAEEVFLQLKMSKTENHNAVLIYIAFKDREFALYGDSNCVQEFPSAFWKKTAKQLSTLFFKQQYKQGIISTILEIEQQLTTYFPSKGGRKNELPDEIVFGK